MEMRAQGWYQCLCDYADVYVSMLISMSMLLLKFIQFGNLILVTAGEHALKLGDRPVAQLPASHVNKK